MSLLGEVASARSSALHVVKVGSTSLSHDRVFDEIRALRSRGARVLLVVGGAAGVAEYYERIGWEVRTVTSRSGDVIRYCPPEEMPHIIAAYEQLTLPRVEERLTSQGLSVFAVTAHRGSLVTARANGPLRVMVDGRTRLIRDHRAGTIDKVDTARLRLLLSAFDVVCLSPPVADLAGGTALNVDADVLAAEAALALDADHLRLVTGTNGLLKVPEEPTSTLRDLLPGEGQDYARGRMRQKVRAAEIALRGAGDVAITGRHTLSTAHGTRFWRAAAPAPDLELLSRTVEIASVSEDEHELAEFLANWCAENGIKAEVDEVGNLVATRGEGPRRMLLLGHLDTVPHRWPVRWEGQTLTGRGSVDAKASLVTFLQALRDVPIPHDAQLRVVGAVQEEVTGLGAFHVRDYYPADAVVIGEPSGVSALTIGYYGLVKVRISVSEPTAHTAGKGVRTAGDRLVEVLHGVRRGIESLHPAVLIAVLGVRAQNHGDVQMGEAVVDVRLPPELAVEELVACIRSRVAEPVKAEVLRAVPGKVVSRSTTLVKSFHRAFGAAGVKPRFLLKKGSSDMNTLATTWNGVPMVAYGPGDAKLDHTPEERVEGPEFRRAQRILQAALREWFAS